MRASKLRKYALAQLLVHRCDQNLLVSDDFHDVQIFVELDATSAEYTLHFGHFTAAEKLLCSVFSAKATPEEGSQSAYIPVLKRYSISFLRCSISISLFLMQSINLAVER